ncbi:MAG: acyl-CoA dehydrogenase family protein [Pikeienuella sp.]
MRRQLPEDLAAIRDGVAAICERFDDEYWLARDADGRFPHEFRDAIAEGGWLGVTMPEEFGGAGLGVREAAVMMNTVARQGAMSAASSIHISMFGPHPIVVFGSDAQKNRWLPPLVRGEDKVAFGVTEPDAGLNTLAMKTFAKKVDGGWLVNGRKIWNSTAQVADKLMLLARTRRVEDARKPTEALSIFYTDFDRRKIEVRLIEKMGRKCVDSNMIFFDDFFIPDEDLIGDEGKGFGYILHSMNPERILIGAEGVGIGEDALRRAAGYAVEREVFGRPIGQNQGIQHPLAENWMNLEAAWLMAMRAAELYDSGQPCGAESNAAKFLGARAGYDAALQSVLTHGGMGYAKEYHVERLLREVMIARIAPVSEQLIASFIGEKVLGLPKSY